MAWTIKFSKEFKDILVKLYEMGEENFHQIKYLNFDFSPRTNWRKLRHWGLIESPQKGSGKITLEGIKFLEGELEIPIELEIENDRVISKSPTMVMVDDF